MGAFRTSVLIGSYASLPLQFMSIDGLAKLVPAGSYYLYDQIGALSLLEQVRLAMVSAGLVGATVTLRMNRKVRIAAPGAFDLTWSSTLLRNLLGFENNLVGLATYDAESISPLLWSPGTPEKPLMTRAGITGHPVHIISQNVAPYSGRTEGVSHGIRYFNEFSWLNIDTDRVITSAGANGEFATWFNLVPARSARFKLYHDASENPDSTAPMSTLTQPLGPYIYSSDRKGVGWKYGRSKGFEWTDQCNDIDMPVHVCPEYNY